MTVHLDVGLRPDNAGIAGIEQSLANREVAARLMSLLVGAGHGSLQAGDRGDGACRC